MRLAIFGGTFDPIHNAHLAIARAAADKCALDRVLFVPAYRPPHKLAGASAPYEHRLRMVELACSADPRFAASRAEEGTERSYSIDTIQRVRSELFAGDHLYFLIGADAFAEIGSWYRHEQVIREVEFIVVSRPEYPIMAPPGARVTRLDGISLDVSSTELRERLERGETPEEIPKAVADYIHQHGLYKTIRPAG